MPNRFFSIEATFNESGWLNYLPNADLSGLVRHHIERYAKDLRAAVGPDVLEFRHTALNAVSRAAGFENYEHAIADTERLKRADGIDDVVREPYCDALPLLMKTPRGPVNPKVYEAHAAFANRLSTVPGITLELVLQILAKRMGGDAYGALMRNGLPTREGQVDQDRMPPPDCAEFSILVSPVTIAPLVAPIRAELEDTEHFRRMDGLVRAAVLPRIPTHVAQLREHVGRGREGDLHRFESVVVSPERGPVGSQYIGGLLSQGWKAYGYWGFTKDTQGEKAPLSLDEYGRRAGGFGDGMYGPELELIQRKFSVQTVVPCPACGNPANVAVSMLPTRNHPGIWKLNCACGHVEEKPRHRDPTLRWSYVNCSCGVCRRHRAKLMSTLEPHRARIRERLVEALDRGVDVMEDAFAGKNGFQATEDGEIWRDGVLYARYVESMTLPASRPLQGAQPLQQEGPRLSRGLPVSVLLESHHGYTRAVYRKPVSGAPAVQHVAMPKTHLDRFLLGFDDEPSFIEWAVAAVAFSDQYMVPLPLSVAVWSGPTPPAWVPASVRARYARTDA